MLSQIPAEALVFLAPQCDITRPSSLPPLGCACRQWVLHGVILLASWARALSPSSQYLRGEGGRKGDWSYCCLATVWAQGQAHSHRSFILTLFPSRFQYFALVKLDMLWYCNTHYEYNQQSKISPLGLVCLCYIVVHKPWNDYTQVHFPSFINSFTVVLSWKVTSPWPSHFSALGLVVLQENMGLYLNLCRQLTIIYIIDLICWLF